MPYALITALIFALVAILHGWRIFKGWTIQIGPHSVSMTVSWIGLVVAMPMSALPPIADMCGATRDVGPLADIAARQIHLCFTLASRHCGRTVIPSRSRCCTSRLG